MNRRPTLTTAALLILTLSTVALAQTRPAEPGHALTIHDAAENGDLEKVKALIAADPSLVNAALQGNKATPLFFAAQKGHVEVAGLLLEKGADVNARARNGYTSLHEACAYGQREVVKLLLKNGALVNFDVKDSAEGDDPDCAPLLLAAENGHLDVVKLLLEEKADVNAKSSYNTVHQSATPLIGATLVQSDYDRRGGPDSRPGSPVAADRKHGYLEVVKALVDKGAKMDLTDNLGHAALFYAAANGQLEVVKYLLERGAGVDVDGKNHNGTPLLFAAQNGDVEVVRLLLAKGANPHAECNSKDKEGKPWTPLKIAEAKGFKAVVELLRNAPGTQPASSPTTQAGMVPSAEQYEKLDPKEPKVTFEADFSSVSFENGGKVVIAQGTVKKFSVGSTDIELVSDKIGVEDKNCVIITKKYGKIRVVLDSNFRASIWVTPVQKAELLKLGEAGKAPGVP